MKDRLSIVLTILFAFLTFWNVIEVGYIFLGWAGVALGIIAIVLLGEFRPSIMTIMSDSLFILTAIFSILVGTFGPPKWYGWATGPIASIALIMLIVLNCEPDEETKTTQNFHPQLGHS